MSKDAKRNFEALLSSVFEKENLDIKIQRSATERYKDFLTQFLDAYEASWQKTLWRLMPTIEAIVILIGTVLGYYLIFFAGPNSKDVHFIDWTVYFVVAIITIFVARLYPKDIENLSILAEKIKYQNALRTLAAKITLFALITDVDTKDDKDTVVRNSKFLPNYGDIADKEKKVIELCNSPDSNIKSSRETNIFLDNRKIIEEQTASLGQATKQIVDLYDGIFSGSNYSAKIYLRTVIPSGPTETEILAAFAKYPAYDSSQGAFGSSWVKTRGNPSQVWQCLESGAHRIVNDFDGEYYSRLLLICLPGRIGVLAITSAENNAFDDKIDEWLDKALAVSSRALVMEALG